MGTVALALMAWLFAAPSLCMADSAPAKKGGPSIVELLAGTQLSRVTLTQKAAERLDIKTTKVTADAAGMLTVPYAAVLYDVKGNTWVYTNPKPLAFVRHMVVIRSITGQGALLTEGPPAGTEIVTVGAAELYGAESGIGK